MPIRSSRTRHTALFAAAALLLFAGAAAAQAPAPVATSRMGVVKGPGVVAPGVFQVEAGYLRGERDGRQRDVYGETLLRVGLGRQTELRATFPSYLRTVMPAGETEGWGDAVLALKHRLRQAAGWRPALSVTLGSTLPTGGDAMGAGAAQPEAVAAAEWRLPSQVALVATAGHRHAVLADDRFGQTTVGGAARVDLSRVVGVQGEYTRVMSTRAGAADANQFRATAGMRVTRDLLLDGWAARVTQDGVPNEVLFGFGFTHRW